MEGYVNFYECANDRICMTFQILVCHFSTIIIYIFFNNYKEFYELIHTEYNYRNAFLKKYENKLFYKFYFEGSY